MKARAPHTRHRIGERREPPQPTLAREHEAAPIAGWSWHILLAGGLLLALLYVVLPYGLFASGVYVFASLGAAAGVAFAVYRRPQTYCRTAWTLIACGLAVTTLGHVIWYWLDLRGLEPFASIADIVYLAAYPLYMVALWIIASPGRGNGSAALSDALIVGVSAAVLGWALLIAPYVHDPGLTRVQLLVATAYPVADLVLLPLILRLVFLHRAGISAHLFLLVGMLAYLAADVLYAHGSSSGWYAPGGFTDALWLVAYALIVAAVWHPSAAIDPDPHAPGMEPSGQRLFVLGAASALVPGVILFTAGTDIETVRVAAIASILLFLLVTYRMAGLIRKTHRQAEALESLSRTDPLTGAANRRHLEIDLVREMPRAERTGSPLCVAVLDLDHFKRFNDSHGHLAGDALLRELVTAWRGVLRPTDVLARVGGEEFVVLCPDTSLDQCYRVVERLRRRVPHGQTCSAGIAAFHPGETAEAFLARADHALYAAKEGGRDRAEWADPGHPAIPSAAT